MITTITITIDTERNTVYTYLEDFNDDSDKSIDYTNCTMGWGNITLGEIVKDYEEWVAEEEDNE